MSSSSPNTRRHRGRIATTIGAGLSAGCLLALAVASTRCSVIFSVEDHSSSGGAPPTNGPSDAGADAACVADADNGSDPQNCGACDHSCLGGQCKQGRCEPVVLASGTGCPMGIAVYGDELYWTEWNGASPVSGGRAARVLLSSRVVTVMAVTTTNPLEIVADESAVYWSELSTKLDPTSGDAGYNDGHVWKLPKSRIGQPGDAGAPEMLRWWDHTIGSIALGSSDVYYGEFHSVNTIPKEGGLYKDVSPKLGLTGGIAVDPTGVYFTDIEGGSVWSFVNGDAAVLTSGADMSPLDLALDLHHVYWTSAKATADAGYRVMKADKYLPGDATVLAQGQQGTIGIAVDGTYVYWTNSLSGEIMRVAKTGGAAQALATGSDPHSIAVDMKAIYWADCGSGSVMMLAK